MIGFLMLAVCGAAELAPPEFFAPNEELRGYLIEAAENHPALKMLHEEWLAALERVPQAQSLDDPMFRFDYVLRSPAGWGRYEMMLSQMFPWFGTLRARGEKAMVEAEAALDRFYAERNQLFSKVKSAYFDYAYLGESIRVVEAQLEVLDYAESVVTARYSLGIGGQEDLLRLQTKRSQVQDRLEEFRQMRPAWAARLNQAIGRETGGELPWPQSAILPAEPPPAPVIVARIRAANPELRESDHLIEGQAKEITLARKAGYPNFTFGISYMDMKDVRNMPRTGPFLEAVEASRSLATPPPIMLPALPGANATPLQRAGALARGVADLRRQGQEATLGGMMSLDRFVELESAFDNLKMKDQITVSLEMNLPIRRNRVRARIQEAKHLERAAEYEKQRRALDLDSEAKMALFGMQDGARRLRLYETTLIPQAEQTFDVVQAAYASGSLDADFLDLLESIDTLLEFELEEARAKRDLQVAAAELERLMGGPWSAEGEPAASSEAAPGDGAPETPEPDADLRE